MNIRRWKYICLMLFSSWSIIFLSGCAMSQSVCKRQSSYSSPLNELTREFKSSWDKVFHGRLVENTIVNDRQVLIFQFPHVLSGPKRIMDIRVTLNDAGAKEGRMEISESQVLKEQIDSAILWGDNHSPPSWNDNGVAQEEGVSFVLWPSIDDGHELLLDYVHTGKIYFVNQECNEEYYCSTSVQLNWVMRKKTISTLHKIPYFISVPVDAVQYVTIFPIDFILICMTGGHGDPMFIDKFVF